MPDPLQTQMIRRWDAIMAEAGRIADYFRSRGWPAPASGAALKPAGKGHKHSGIKYSREIPAFLESIQPGVIFGLQDFVTHMLAKYPEAKLNKHSLRAPFLKLVDSGALSVVQKGVGKKPVLYCRGAIILDRLAG